MKHDEANTDNRQNEQKSTDKIYPEINTHNDRKNSGAAHWYDNINIMIVRKIKVELFI